nr:PREDICTED: uncharacterized protein LOC109030178 [Bemisia tabaci]
MQPGIVLKALVNMTVGKNSNRQTATVVVLDTTITPIANLATVILMVLLILIVKQKASNVLVSITMLESSVTSAGKDFTIFLNVFPVSVTQQEPKQIFVIQKLVIVLVRTVMVVEHVISVTMGTTTFLAVLVSDRLYVGGYPGDYKLPDVSNTGFDGCVDNVQIMSISVDLSKNINALDVVPGCPEE